MKSQVSLSKFKTSLAVCLMMLISGCALIAKTKTLPQFPLLKPESYPQRHQVSQTFTLKGHPANDNQPQSMLAVWSTSERELLFSALTPTGQPLVSARLSEGNFSAETSPLLPDHLSPKAIVSQLQIAYWPATSIRAATDNNDWSFTEENTTRTLYYRSKKVMEIHRISEQRLILTHHIFGFTADIRTLKKEALP